MNISPSSSDTAKTGEGPAVIFSDSHRPILTSKFGTNNSSESFQSPQCAPTIGTPANPLSLSGASPGALVPAPCTALQRSLLPMQGSNPAMAQNDSLAPARHVTLSPSKRRRRMPGPRYRSTPRWLRDAISQQAVRLPAPSKSPRRVSEVLTARDPSAYYYEWNLWLAANLNQSLWEPGAAWTCIGRSLYERAAEREQEKNEDRKMAVEFSLRETIRLLLSNIVARDRALDPNQPLPENVQVIIRCATWDQSKILFHPGAKLEKLTLAVLARAALVSCELGIMAQEIGSVGSAHCHNTDTEPTRGSDAIRERISAAVSAEEAVRCRIIWDFVCGVEMSGPFLAAGFVRGGFLWDRFDSCCLLLSKCVAIFSQSLPLPLEQKGGHAVHEWVLTLMHPSLASQWASLIRNALSKWNLISSYEELGATPSESRRLFEGVGKRIVSQCLRNRVPFGTRWGDARKRGAGCIGVGPRDAQMECFGTTAESILSQLMLVISSLQELHRFVSQSHPWIVSGGSLSRNSDLTKHYQIIHSGSKYFANAVGHIQTTCVIYCEMFGECATEELRLHLGNLALELEEFEQARSGTAYPSTWSIVRFPIKNRWIDVVGEVLRLGFLTMSKLDMDPPAREIMDMGRRVVSAHFQFSDIVSPRRRLASHENILSALDLVYDLSGWDPNASRCLLDAVLSIGNDTRDSHARGVMGYPIQWRREIGISQMVRKAYGTAGGENLKYIRSTISRLSRPLQLFPKEDLSLCDERAVAMLERTVEGQNDPQAMEIYANVLRGRGPFAHFKERGYVVGDIWRAKTLLLNATHGGSIRSFADIPEWIHSIEAPLPTPYAQELVDCLAKVSRSSIEAAYRFGNENLLNTDKWQTLDWSSTDNWPLPAVLFKHAVSGLETNAAEAWYVARAARKLGSYLMHCDRAQSIKYYNYYIQLCLTTLQKHNLEWSLAVDGCRLGNLLQNDQWNDGERNIAESRRYYSTFFNARAPEILTGITLYDKRFGYVLNMCHIYKSREKAFLDALGTNRIFDLWSFGQVVWRGRRLAFRTWEELPIEPASFADTYAVIGRQ